MRVPCPRPRSRTIVSLAGLVAAIVFGWLLTADGVSRSAPAGQSALPSGQQPSRPTFHTEANFIRVDVYPLHDGAPVRDLRQDEFEILEDGRPQTIATFEHIVLGPGGAEQGRLEPNTVAQSRQMAAESRARLFVIFLDFNHVEVGGSHDVRQPLVEALDRLIGDDDLIAVMTPEMSAAQIAFARRTGSLEDILSRYWTWGERDTVVTRDPIDDQYRACYPGTGPTLYCPDDDRGIAEAMVERRKEKQTLDALGDLVRYLRTVREERKAIVTISDGWRLFRPDASLARSVNCGAPSGRYIGTDPRTGSPAIQAPPHIASSAVCERDRLAFAQMDDDRELRDIVEEADRANCSFYTVDPRGLVAFDTSLAKHITGDPPRGTTTLTPPSVDAAYLRARIDSLRTLAEGTDGLAMVNANDLRGGFARIVADLSSYYLLGYYSNGRLDGRFHSISVRVKRPGVQVRARRGYRAMTPKEAAAVPARGIDPAADAVKAAVATLSTLRPQAPIRFRVGRGFVPTAAEQDRTGVVTAVWVAGELDADRSSTREWERGATTSVTLTRTDGSVVSSARASLAPGARNLLVRLPQAGRIEPGRYVVRIDARPVDGTPLSESAPLEVPASGTAFGDPLLFRRGPFTGRGWQPVGDARFRREERLRVEVPFAGRGGTVSARLLDRTGGAIELPVVAGEDLSSGARTITADLSLAPLAASDYVLEIAVTKDGEQQRVLAAFRIVNG